MCLPGCEWRGPVRVLARASSAPLLVIHTRGSAGRAPVSLRGGRGSGRSATAGASLIAGCCRAAGSGRGQDALSGKTLVGRVREGGGVVDGRRGLRDARRVLVVSEVRLQLILNRKSGSVS